jgi:hypothetical protein
MTHRIVLNRMALGEILALGVCTDGILFMCSAAGRKVSNGEIHFPLRLPMRVRSMPIAGMQARTAFVNDSAASRGQYRNKLQLRYAGEGVWLRDRRG